MTQSLDPNSPCVCGSGNPYGDCCRRFHQGELPSNALLLMRSRYAAYALNLPDYIIKTTHPASPGYSDNLFNWRRSLEKFSRYTQFQKLDILDFKEKGEVATVVFTSYLKQGESDASFTELSYFEKLNGQWLYRAGKLMEGHAPTLVSAGQLHILPLAYYGDPVLHHKAVNIDNMDENLCKLVEEMVETMDAEDGIGLAAPQVHYGIRLFLVRMPIEHAEDDVEFTDVKVFLNAEILSYSEESWIYDEGCLSIPGIRADVKRAKTILIRYLDLDGKQHEEEYSGWAARVIQHEYDHIEGVLFTDRLDKKAKEKILPALNLLKKRLHDHRSL